MLGRPKTPLKKHERGDIGNGLNPIIAKKDRRKSDATLEKNNLLKSLSEIGTTSVERVKRISPKI